MADKNLNIKVKADVSELTKLRREVTQTGSEFLKAKNSGKSTADEMNRLGNAFKNAQGRLYDARNALKEVGQTAKMSKAQLLEFGENLTVVSAGVVAAFSKIRGSANSLLISYNDLEKSNRKLEATSKLTGTSFEFLKDVTKDAQVSLGLTVKDSNELTIALTKLGQKAGDTTKTKDALKALLDLGAAQGLDVDQSIVAINQAILGIDEGTDKLFQKNPSQIYKEFADSIGTTAGKLTDQQKAQALLNETVEKGGRVQGEYAKYLDTFAGKQQLLTQKLEVLKQGFGETVAKGVTPFVDALLEADNGSTKLAGGLVLVGGSITDLIPAFAGAKYAMGGFFSAATLGVAGAVAAFGGLVAYMKSVGADLLNFNPAEFLRKRIESDVEDQIAINEATKNPITDKLVENALKTNDAKKKAFDESKKNIPKVSTGSGSTTEKIQEVTNEIIDLGKQIADLEAKLAITDTGTTLFSKYTNEIKELQKQLDFFNMSMSDLTNITAKPEGERLLSVSFVRPPIDEIIDPMLQFRLDIQAQEEAKAERQKAIDDTETVYSGITNILSALNVGTETFVGKILSGFDSAATIIKSLQTINSVFSLIPGFASGGEALAGMPYMAGERGTELIFPQTNHTVLNHSDTMRYLNSNSGGQVNVYVSSNVNQRYLDVGIEKHNSTKNYIKVSKR